MTLTMPRGIPARSASSARARAEKGVWEAGGWAPRLGLPTDPEATGFGFNPEQVANFPVPPVALLLEYQRAVRQTTMKFVAGLGSADLECIVKRPRLADQTLLARLARIVVEVSQHSGQIDYIRGLKRNLGA